ncbi:YolD-like family protein [Sporosarcina sp. NPDC096371]|uniref:YolD-like family protein n=1 Tax=Sporosarcina sp. NPDC096371 TaxID=3364530 RepID=UPI0038116518
MIQDRGNIKWRGMMLTEHTKRINSWLEDDKKTEKPQLDDLELGLIADEIERAYKSRTTIKLTYWRGGYLDDDYGKIIEINTTNHTLVLDDPFSTTRYPFDEIVAVSLIA